MKKKKTKKSIPSLELPISYLSGSITQAVKKVKQVSGFSLKVEVEARNEVEANEAIQAGADIVMLDNYNGLECQLAATRLKILWGGKKQFWIEASGGLTEENCEDYMGKGTVYYILFSTFLTFRHR